MGVLALIAGVVILVCVLVVLGGRYVNRRLAKNSPDSAALKKLTLVGVLVQAGLVLYLLIGTAIYHVAPETVIGVFLNSWYGWPVALVVGLAVFTAVAAVLAYLGYPMVRLDSKRG